MELSKILGLRYLVRLYGTFKNFRLKMYSETVWNFQKFKA